MAETIVDKAVCEKCGSDVREETAFCYNCGAAVAIAKPEEPLPKASLNGAASPAEKRTRAASERKKARVSRRKTVEYTWEPTNNIGLTLIATLVLSVIVLVMVFLLVIWK